MADEDKGEKKPSIAERAAKLQELLGFGKATGAPKPPPMPASKKAPESKIKLKTASPDSDIGKRGAELQEKLKSGSAAVVSGVAGVFSAAAGAVASGVGAAAGAISGAVKFVADKVRPEPKPLDKSRIQDLEDKLSGKSDAKKTAEASTEVDTAEVAEEVKTEIPVPPPMPGVKQKKISSAEIPTPPPMPGEKSKKISISRSKPTADEKQADKNQSIGSRRQAEVDRKLDEVRDVPFKAKVSQPAIPDVSDKRRKFNKQKANVERQDIANNKNKVGDMGSDAEKRYKDINDELNRREHYALKADGEVVAYEAQLNELYKQEQAAQTKIDKISYWSRDDADPIYQDGAKKYKRRLLTPIKRSENEIRLKLMNARNRRNSALKHREALILEQKRLVNQAAGDKYVKENPIHEADIHPARLVPKDERNIPVKHKQQHFEPPGHSLAAVAASTSRAEMPDDIGISMSIEIDKAGLAKIAEEMGLTLLELPGSTADEPNYELKDPDNPNRCVVVNGGIITASPEALDVLSMAARIAHDAGAIEPVQLHSENDNLERLTAVGDSLIENGVLFDVTSSEAKGVSLLDIVSNMKPENQSKFTALVSQYEDLPSHFSEAACAVQNKLNAP